MILGFKNQFVPFVLDGSKTHTIRAGNRWRAGMRADLFANVRQKDMRLIFRAPVVRVESIEIRMLKVMGPDISIGPNVLSYSERDLFAWSDGFRHRTLANPTDTVSVVSPATVGCFDMMMAFWAQEHGFGTKITVFRGQIVHWDYAARFTDISETCFRESARRATAARKVLL